MSLTGSATEPNLSVLRGKIAAISPNALDTSLSVEGASAEAKATGDAIKAVRENHADHAANKSNPHNVTKKQLGLGNVDDTADTDKPVSKAQAEAIADAKKAGTDAQAALELAMSERNEFTDEEKEKLASIEAGANKYEPEEVIISTEKLADSAVTAEKIAAGAVSGLYNAVIGTTWIGNTAPYTQTVFVEGMPNSDRVICDLVPSDDWEAEEEAFANIISIFANENEITVKAKEKTEIPINIKLLVIHGSGLGSGGDTGGSVVTDEQIEEIVSDYLAKNNIYGSKATIGTVDLLADKWVGSNNLYFQVVSIEGVTEKSQVNITPSVAQLLVFYEKDLTFVTENEGGVVTVYVIGQKPENDYRVQVTITEVIV